MEHFTLWLSVMGYSLTISAGNETFGFGLEFSFGSPRGKIGYLEVKICNTGRGWELYKNINQYHAN